MIRRKIEDDDDENPDRWLVSYADFITLLFAFFVVMYSVSSVNEGKYKELSSAINTAFASKKSNPENIGQVAESSQAVANKPADNPTEIPAASILPSSAATTAEQVEVETMTSLGKQMADKLSPLIKTGMARVIQNNRGLRIDIKDSVLFTTGSADLTVPAKATLNHISTLLSSNTNPILVEGHTDDAPIYIQNAAFFSNWELSAVRASSIVSHLNATGIENIRLSALGYGPSQPISSNTTEEGRMTNRHISIVVLYNSLNIDGSEGIEVKPD